MHQAGQSQGWVSNLHPNHQSHCQRDPKTVTYLNTGDFPLLLFCYQPMPEICCTNKKQTNKQTETKGKLSHWAFSQAEFIKQQTFCLKWFVINSHKKFWMVWWSIFQDCYLLKFGKNIEIFNPPNFILLKQEINTGKQC